MLIRIHEIVLTFFNIATAPCRCAAWGNTSVTAHGFQCGSHYMKVPIWDYGWSAVWTALAEVFRPLGPLTCWCDVYDEWWNLSVFTIMPGGRVLVRWRHRCPGDHFRRSLAND